MSLTDIRFLSFDQYEAFLSAARVRCLERERDLFLAMNHAQSKDPGAALQKRELFIESLMYGEIVKQSDVVDIEMTAMFGESVYVGSDDALENLGISKGSPDQR